MTTLYQERQVRMARKVKVNLLEKKEITETLLPRKSHHPALIFWGKILGIFLIAVLLVAGALSLKLISSISSLDQTGSGKISFFQQINHLITRQDDKIRGEEQDRINIVLMGVGGAGHEGSLLTDTIMVVSFRPSTKQVALLSIPRDLAVEFPKPYYWRKINNALFFGQEMDYPGGGEKLLVNEISDITGLDINYYGRVDFAGFTQLIDGLGGLAINVEKSFADSQYPAANYGYQTVKFTAGEQAMSGETALKYVRSRHGNNGEGSDFARAKRQQNVILALKDKITAFSTLINPKKISEILATLGGHTKTDLEIWEILRLYKLAQNISEDKIITRVLDNSKTGLLKTETGENGAYLLVPRSGDYTEIKQLARDIFSQSSIEEEKAKIAVENGTKSEGLARTAAAELTSLNFNIVRVSNHPDNGVEKTIIYDSTNGRVPYTLNSLKERFNASVITDLPYAFGNIDPDQELNINSLSPLANLNSNQPDNYDILIILGADQIETNSLSFNQ